LYKIAINAAKLENCILLHAIHARTVTASSCGAQTKSSYRIYLTS